MELREQTQKMRSDESEVTRTLREQLSASEAESQMQQGLVVELTQTVAKLQRELDEMRESRSGCERELREVRNECSKLRDEMSTATLESHEAASEHRQRVEELESALESAQGELRGAHEAEA